MSNIIMQQVKYLSTDDKTNQCFFEDTINNKLYYILVNGILECECFIIESNGMTKIPHKSIIFEMPTSNTNTARMVRSWLIEHNLLVKNAGANWLMKRLILTKNHI